LDKLDIRRCSKRDTIEAEKAIIFLSPFGESSLNVESIDDLNKPITQRKEVRSCTKHYF